VADTAVVGVPPAILQLPDSDVPLIVTARAAGTPRQMRAPVELVGQIDPRPSRQFRLQLVEISHEQIVHLY